MSAGSLLPTHSHPHMKSWSSSLWNDSRCPSETASGHHCGPHPLAQFLPSILLRPALQQPSLRLLLPLLASAGTKAPKSKSRPPGLEGSDQAPSPGSVIILREQPPGTLPMHAQPGTSKTPKAQDIEGHDGVIMFLWCPGTGRNLDFRGFPTDRGGFEAQKGCNYTRGHTAPNGS